MTLIDAHVHVWDPRVLDYPWLRDAGAAARAHLPSQVDRAGGRTTGMVFVQADCAPEQSLSEVEWISRLAPDWPELAGVVAGADVRSPGVEKHLDDLAAAGPVRGIRHILQEEPAERLAEPALQRGLEELAARGLAFDACVRADQLDALVRLLSHVPTLAVVLDHLGKPPVAEGVASTEGRAWCTSIDALAALPNAFVKLSGLIPEVPDEATLRKHAPGFVAHVLRAFGPERAMVGSDWPVSGLWGPDVGFAAWLDLVQAQTEGDDAWDAISHTTAGRFYRLPTESEGLLG
jgi:L-fuconolactonase